MYYQTDGNTWWFCHICSCLGDLCNPTSNILRLFLILRSRHEVVSPVQIQKRRFAHKIFSLPPTYPRCLKITEKVSFNIASEESYVYILSGQKLIKNAKNALFGEFLKTWSLRSNSVTRQVSFSRTKIGGKCQNSKIQMRHFE